MYTCMVLLSLNIHINQLLIICVVLEKRKTLNHENAKETYILYNIIAPMSCKGRLALASL